MIKNNNNNIVFNGGNVEDKKKEITTETSASSMRVDDKPNSKEQIKPYIFESLHDEGIKYWKEIKFKLKEQSNKRHQANFCEFEKNSKFKILCLESKKYLKATLRLILSVDLDYKHDKYFIESEIKTFYYIGMINLKLKKYNNAIKYFNKGIETAEKEGNEKCNKKDNNENIGEKNEIKETNKESKCIVDRRLLKKIHYYLGEAYCYCGENELKKQNKRYYDEQCKKAEEHFKRSVEYNDCYENNDYKKEIKKNGKDNEKNAFKEYINNHVGELCEKGAKCLKDNNFDEAIKHYNTALLMIKSFKFNGLTELTLKCTVELANAWYKKAKNIQNNIKKKQCGKSIIGINIFESMWSVDDKQNIKNDKLSNELSGESKIKTCADNLCEIGANFFEQGDFINANEIFKKVLEIDNGCGLALYYQGLICHQKQEYGNAVNLFEKALQKDFKIRLNLNSININNKKSNIGNKKSGKEIYSLFAGKLLKESKKFFDKHQYYESEAYFSNAFNLCPSIKIEKETNNMLIDLYKYFVVECYKKKEYEKVVWYYNELKKLCQDFNDESFTGKKINNCTIYQKNDIEQKTSEEYLKLYTIYRDSCKKYFEERLFVEVKRKIPCYHTKNSVELIGELGGGTYSTIFECIVDNNNNVNNRVNYNVDSDNIINKKKSSKSDEDGDKLEDICIKKNQPTKVIKFFNGNLMDDDKHMLRVFSEIKKLIINAKNKTNKIPDGNKKFIINNTSSVPAINCDGFFVWDTYNHGSEVHPKQIGIMMPKFSSFFSKKGCLFSKNAMKMFKKNGKDNKYKNFIEFAGKFISAVQHCNEQKLTHGDIKEENLLIDESDNIILTDFGSTKIMDKPTKQFKNNFTFQYVSKNSLNLFKNEENSYQEQVFFKKCDIYAVGIVLLNVFRVICEDKEESYSAFFGMSEEELQQDIESFLKIYNSEKNVLDYEGEKEMLAKFISEFLLVDENRKSNDDVIIDQDISLFWKNKKELLNKIYEKFNVKINDNFDNEENNENKKLN